MEGEQARRDRALLVRNRTQNVSVYTWSKGAYLDSLPKGNEKNQKCREFFTFFSRCGADFI